MLNLIILETHHHRKAVIDCVELIVFNLLLFFSACRNPTKGTIVSVADDTDVYSGVPKDYTGKVTFIMLLF